MAHVSVSLFGKLEIRLDGQPPEKSLSGKAEELLAYLLLYPREHPREKVATLLWEHGSTERSKAYLRKALWKLRQVLAPDDGDPCLVKAEGDWLRVDPDARLWVDAREFETAFDAVRDRDPSDMTDAQVQSLEEAAALYTGDLLENWYQEWCLRERERLQNLWLRMLDRLTRCCEGQGRYDTGIRYARRVLRVDPARERTHRQLMRLRARAGNRTGALRQYERCADVLDRELGVDPATATRCLYQQIRADRFALASPDASNAGGADAAAEDIGDDTGTDTGDDLSAPAAPGVLPIRGDGEPVPRLTVENRGDGEGTLRDGLDRIRQLQSTLDAIQRQIRHEIEAVEGALHDRLDPGVDSQSG